MKIFYYDKSFDGLLSAVFDAYMHKEFPNLLLGKDDIPPLTASSFHNVVTEAEKASRVFKGLVPKLTGDARRELFYAWLSEQAGADMLLFRYICKIFNCSLKRNHGRTGTVETDLGDDGVFAVHRLAKKVGSEKHQLLGFARFQKTRDGVYFAAISPRHNVLPLLLDHFADRFADQSWILFDLKREYGVLYSDGDFSQVHLEASRLHRLRQHGGKLELELLESGEVMFQKLWKNYFKAVAIDERSNPKLQSRCMPRRYWAYMTETQETPPQVYKEHT